MVDSLGGRPGTGCAARPVTKKSYYVERHPIGEPKVTARLKALAAASDTRAVCDLARAECLIDPLKNANAIVLGDYQRL